MPSWNDGESSNAEYLGDLTELDYAPETVNDPTFNGIAVGCPEVCRVHRLEPRKCVAFEGVNTGRKFYMCQVENQVENCGFQSWLDPDWPETLQQSLRRLWSMYCHMKCMRIDERVENGRVVEQLSEDMKKLEKKHASLLEDVRNFMDTTGQRVMENNLGLIKGNSVQRRNELGELKKELDMLKNVQRTQAEVFKAKQKTLEDERDAIKEEKKKLEYIIYDMLQQKAAVEGSVQEKLQRIKDICDEP